MEGAQKNTLEAHQKAGIGVSEEADLDRREGVVGKKTGKTQEKSDHGGCLSKAQEVKSFCSRKQGTNCCL